MSEQELLLPLTEPPAPQALTSAHRKHALGRFLESKPVHISVIALIAVDACFVLADLSYTFLNEQCDPNGSDKNPQWLETLSLLSICITTIFLIEIPLALYAFGTRYYNPFRRTSPPHAGFHLLDALVITGTFILEVTLRGREQELAGLLILLRFWRLIKLVGGVAVGVGEFDEENLARLIETEQRLDELERELSEERRLVVEIREHLQGRGDEVGLGVVERKKRPREDWRPEGEGR